MKDEVLNKLKTMSLCFHSNKWRNSCNYNILWDEYKSWRNKVVDIIRKDNRYKLYILL